MFHLFCALYVYNKNFKCKKTYLLFSTTRDLTPILPPKALSLSQPAYIPSRPAVILIRKMTSDSLSLTPCGGGWIGKGGGLF